RARGELNAPALAELADLDDAGFRALFAGSPVKRIGHGRFLRNVMIAIGNSGDERLLAPATRSLGDPDPLIRGAAVWAVRRLAAPDVAEQLRLAFQPQESDVTVQTEWAGPVEPAPHL